MTSVALANSIDVPAIILDTSCGSDVYEDVLDMIIMAGVFGVGWFIFHWLAIAIQMPRKVSPKAAAYSKLGRTHFIEQDAANSGYKRISPTCNKIAYEDLLLDTKLKSWGLPASPEALGRKAVVLGPEGDACGAPCGGPCGSPTVDTAAATRMQEVQESDACSVGGLDEGDLDICDGFGAEWAPREEEAERDLDAEAGLCDTVASGGLSSMWPSESADAAAEADEALETAVALGDADLAEAALIAGSRSRSASWLAEAGGRLHGLGLLKSPEHEVRLAWAYAREHRADLAAELWYQHCAEHDVPVGRGKMTSEEVPAPELYGAALEACTAAADFTSAMRLASSAAWHAPPSIAGQAAMLTLARWLARQHSVESARKCIMAVRRAGGAVDLPTFRVLLTSSARGGDMVQAHSMFEEMVSAGLRPNFAVFSIMVRGYCAVGNAEQALANFSVMKQCGLQPDTALFDAVLGVCASRNLLDVAEAVLSEMEAAVVRPTSATLAILVRLYGARGAFDFAMQLFEELPRRHGLQPDARAHQALISICLKGGRHDLALEAFAKMSGAGCLASAKTYEALISSCCRRGDLDGAIALVGHAMGLLPPVALAARPGAPTEPPPGATSEPGSERAASAATARPLPLRAMLEPRTVEELLQLIGCRGQAAKLGLPFLAQLQDGGVEIPEALAAALRRAAGPPGRSAVAEAGGSSPRGTAGQSLRAQREARRADWCRWRQSFDRFGSASNS